MLDVGIKKREGYGSRTLHIISNSRRRALLEYLIDNEGKVHIKDAVNHILTLEGSENNSRARKSVYVSLLQTHLPTLERARLVSFSRSTSQIALMTIPEDMKVYLEPVKEGDISWSRYYFLLSIMALSGSAYINDIWAVVMSSVFLTSSLFNIYYQKIKI